MRVIIAGSRGIEDYSVVHAAATDSKFEIHEVVSGGARGVDQLGEQFAEKQGLYLKRFFPDWNRLGKMAGFVRNAEMGDYADALIAVWDGESKGTKHMIDYMTKLNKKVFIYNATK